MSRFRIACTEAVPDVWHLVLGDQGRGACESPRRGWGGSAEAGSRERHTTWVNKDTRRADVLPHRNRVMWLLRATPPVALEAWLPGWGELSWLPRSPRWWGQVHTPGLLRSCPHRLWGKAQASASVTQRCRHFWVCLLRGALARPGPRGEACTGSPGALCLPSPPQGSQPLSCGGGPS